MHSCHQTSIEKLFEAIATFYSRMYNKPAHRGQEAVVSSDSCPKRDELMCLRYWLEALLE